MGTMSNENDYSEIKGNRGIKANEADERGVSASEIKSKCLQA